MALNAYLKLKGQIQGDIKGSVRQKGREGKILVIAAEHQIVSPRDPASGLATGRRQHMPFMVTKEIDASSPLLYSMLVKNENITEFELQCWAPQTKAGAGTGAEVQHYTVKLSNAALCEIRFEMPNNRDPALVKLAGFEVLSFTYGKIQWLWTAGGITAEDDWDTRPGAAPGKLPKAAKVAEKRPAKRA